MHNLSFTGSDLAEYMQVQLIKNYPDGRLVISIKDAGAPTTSKNST